jgi:uncharacterized phage protein (TIGR01671 family)
MKREIKFRSWNPDDNKMEYPLVVSICANGKSQPLIVLSDGTRAYKDYPLMQYIGINDINEKEIYDGDIVKYYQPYAKKWERHIVGWDDELACFALYEDGSIYFKECDWIKILDIEVVGNKYESPESLFVNDNE